MSVTQCPYNSVCSNAVDDDEDEATAALALEQVTRPAVPAACTFQE